MKIYEIETDNEWYTKEVRCLNLEKVEEINYNIKTKDLRLTFRDSAVHFYANEMDTAAVFEEIKEFIKGPELWKKHVSTNQSQEDRKC